MARPKDDGDKPLTDVELQVMNVLWSCEKASVHQVLDVLNHNGKRDYAYTTVSTLLRVLEKKGVVGSEKVGRGHLYFAQVQKENYQEKAAKHLVTNVFEGSATNLIRNLLGTEKLTQEELAEVQQLLSKKVKS